MYELDLQSPAEVVCGMSIGDGRDIIILKCLQHPPVEVSQILLHHSGMYSMYYIRNLLLIAAGLCLWQFYRTVKVRHSPYYPQQTAITASMSKVNHSKSCLKRVNLMESDSGTRTPT